MSASLTQDDLAEKLDRDSDDGFVPQIRRRKRRVGPSASRSEDILIQPPRRSRLQRLVIPTLSILIFLTCARILAQLWRYRARIFPPDLFRRGQPADPFTEWVKQSSDYARQAVLRNIGPIAGAKDGLVIASPSKGDTADVPDYYYTWTRDSALVLLSLLPDFLPDCYLSIWADEQSSCSWNETGELLLEPLVREYIESQAAIQTLETPSGNMWTGGLNEPKFHVDGSVFDGPWGRPQRDGPALRVLSVIPYALYLLDRSWPADEQYLKKHLYNPGSTRFPGSLIKNDLEEVANAWEQPSFDLWEEVDAHHLFTRLVSLRALRAGAVLADRLGDDGAAKFYSSQSAKLSSTLEQFRDPQTSIWRAMIPKDGQTVDRSGLDCAVPLSLIHAGLARSQGQGRPLDFQGSDPRSLATLREYVLSFGDLYAINAGRRWTEGWAVGRYTEDVYDGVGKSQGNPWFICTHSVAEVLYMASNELRHSSSIFIDHISLPFWQDLNFSSKPVAGEIWPNTSAEYEQAIERIRQIGDQFLNIQQRLGFVHLSEQINRDTGVTQGARDLTWSYASFLSAARARANIRTAWRAGQ